MNLSGLCQNCGVRGPCNPDLSIRGCRCRTPKPPMLFGAKVVERPDLQPPLKRVPRGGQATHLALVMQLTVRGYVEATLLHRCPDTPASRIFVRELHYALDRDPPRDWHADVGFPVARLLVEIKGGAHAAKRSHLADDVEREHAAVALGWRLLPVTPEMVRDGRAIDGIVSILGG